MSWEGLACFVIMVVGAILFLYGANYYNAGVGWTGFGLFVAGLFAYILLKVYEAVTKKETGQKP
jgi:positive regulator of sigma E activity